MANTQIPREAVDAAARGLGNHINVDFDVLGPVEQLEAREAALAALNAAAPHLLATRDVEVQTLTAQRDEAWAEIKHLSKLLDERDAKERATIASHQLHEPQPESLGRIARVWSAGDPEPEDAPAVRDAMGDVWTRRESNGLWYAPDTAPFTWEHIAKKWSPLTEVLDVKAGV